MALSAERSTTVSIELRRLTTATETLVVTATGTEYSVQDAPVRTGLIRREDAEKRVKTITGADFRCSRFATPGYSMRARPAPFRRALPRRGLAGGERLPAQPLRQPASDGSMYSYSLDSLRGV